MSEDIRARRERWRRVNEIYDQALDSAPADRLHLIETACAGDATLRAEVDSLLAWSADTGSFIESPALEVASHLLDSLDDRLTGTVLGGYVIGEWLGSGGMGDVYRARDTQLQRDVALKVLPILDVATDRQQDTRVGRFRREAQVLASLNHPNVAAIHGFVEGRTGTASDDVPVFALALELVAGPTLAERIADGPIPVTEALAIARQIADGMRAAHALGVIHRDLKPGNIKLRPDGTVKILDFGLAKVVDAGAEAGAPVGSAPEPGGARHGLHVSTALGTAAYMSPEQVQGRAVDQRSDVWAFGAVLYEMLAGRRAFAGRGLKDTLDAVSSHPVDWTALPADTPTPVRELLIRCLDRDPNRRPRDLGETRAALEPARSRAISRRTVLGALGVGAAGTAAAWYVSTPSPRRSRAVRLPFILPAEAAVLLPATRQALALAPDGTQFVYAASNQLYRRSLSESDARPLTGSEGFRGVHQPTFSPDSRFVAFWAESDRTLKRVPAEGGAPVTICDLDNPFGMSWDEEGLLVGQGRRGIVRVDARGGRPRTLIQVAEGEEAHGPQQMPNGAVLYTVASGVDWMRWEDARVVIQAPGSHDRTTVVAGGTDARVLPTSHLVFAHGITLFAAGFDARRRRLTTSPVAVIDRVVRANDRNTGTAQYSTSDTGRLIYMPVLFEAPEWGNVRLVIADRTGALEHVPITPGPYRGVRAAPIGRRITFVADGTPTGIVYTCDLDRPGDMRRLPGPGDNRHPLFATDAGRLRVVFQSDRDGDRAIYWQDPDVDGPAERLTTPGPGESHAPESWAGDTLLFSVTKGFDVSLWTLSLRDRRPVPFGGVRSAYPINTRFSPDGRWVAYTTHNAETGEGTNLFVQPFPATGARHQLRPLEPPQALNTTPHKPVWSPDGRELFYVPRLGAFEAVTVTTSPVFAFGTPQPMRRSFSPGAPSFRSLFDVMPDGRFVGVVPATTSDSFINPSPGIQVVLDWFDELREKVPV